MKIMKIKKVFESKKIDRMLSTLCDVRDAIYYQNKEKTSSLIDIFEYNFNEIDYTDLFRDDDNRIYVIQTASNKFLEVEKEDMKNFEY